MDAPFLTQNSTKQQFYDIVVNEVESEQSMFGLGFRSTSYTYYSTEKGNLYESSGAEFLIGYQIGLDIRKHTRAIYGVWDFLGDVGGLFDMLKLLAEPIIALSTALFGNGLSRFLTSSLFKIEKRHKANQSVFSYIKHRKHIKTKICNWLCDRQNQKLHKQAENRIAKELDIVNFLKQ